MRKLNTAFLILLAMNSYTFSQDITAFEKKEFIKGKDTLRYRIMYPLNFNPNVQYPLIVFLHGSGERGNDNIKQLVHGAKFFANDDNRSKYPAIVVFPQCPKDDFWAKVVISKAKEGPYDFNFDPFGKPTKPMSLTIKLVNSIRREKYVDQERVYIGGLSMGGMGAFEILYRCPKVFAAAFPICGGGNPNSVGKYAKRVKLWVFHGAKDDIVSVDQSNIMVNAIKEAKGSVKYTIYPDAKHNSWDNVFLEPDLLPWLFSVRKK